MDQNEKMSMKYFMTEMTQEEFEKFRPKTSYETLWSREERFILNKIRSEKIQSDNP